MLPLVCSVIDHRGRQNVVRPSVIRSAIALGGTFLFFYHILIMTSSVIARQHGIYLLIIRTLSVNQFFTAANTVILWIPLN